MPEIITAGVKSTRFVLFVLRMRESGGKKKREREREMEKEKWNEIEKVAMQ